MTAFDRFADLAKRIVAVPKSEVDAQREAEKSAKEQRPAGQRGKGKATG